MRPTDVLWFSALTVTFFSVLTTGSEVETPNCFLSGLEQEVYIRCYKLPRVCKNFDVEIFRKKYDTCIANEALDDRNAESDVLSVLKKCVVSTSPQCIFLNRELLNEVLNNVLASVQTDNDTSFTAGKYFENIFPNFSKYFYTDDLLFKTPSCRKSLTAQNLEPCTLSIIDKLSYINGKPLGPFLHIWLYADDQCLSSRMPNCSDAFIKEFMNLVIRLSGYMYRKDLIKAYKTSNITSTGWDFPRQGTNFCNHDNAHRNATELCKPTLPCSMIDSIHWFIQITYCLLHSSEWEMDLSQKYHVYEITEYLETCFVKTERTCRFEREFPTGALEIVIDLMQTFSHNIIESDCLKNLTNDNIAICINPDNHGMIVNKNCLTTKLTKCSQENINKIYKMFWGVLENVWGNSSETIATCDPGELVKIERCYWKNGTHQLMKNGVPIAEDLFREHHDSNPDEDMIDNRSKSFKKDISPGETPSNLHCFSNLSFVHYSDCVERLHDFAKQVWSGKQPDIKMMEVCMKDTQSFCRENLTNKISTTIAKFFKPVSSPEDTTSSSANLDNLTTISAQTVTGEPDSILKRLKRKLQMFIQYVR